ncbi:L-2-hydroxyglutarate oxidase [Paractinoplanes ferrugineus]|uniref:Hydroxyglutarate oxidase n=2 Tax=Paractinoplanes ferrugineus TaxID=113564 RepID=A0A919ME35_9ACTN|nr:hydroxyglutarate oxidase [Actinoplanes ferrugineus]
MLREYCLERKLPYDECGKLVVAVDPGEVTRLDALAERAAANSVPGLRRVGPAEIRDLEPYATGLAALHSPRTAITDYVAVARAFAEEIEAAGGEIRLNFPVRRVTPAPGGGLLISARPPHRSAVAPSGGAAAAGGDVAVDELIVCAGLQSDLVAGLAGDEAGPRIVPFRGAYMRVVRAKADLVRGLIYPVPDPRYPFLGVHFTRRVDGSVEVGPNAVLATAREGYRLADLSLREVYGIASWPGAWRMAGKHWRTGVREIYGSLSVRAYMRAARRYVPLIGAGDVVRAGAGVRAQALDRDGSLVDDFRIHRVGTVTAVRNAPSPAATSSMAIAEHVVNILEEQRQ